jgi:biopolymer transport protein ExbD
MGMNVNLEGGAESEDAGSEQVVAEINITPLTDVFLVLLIIFMVTATAVVDHAEKAAREGVKVALPKANAAGPVSKRKTDPIVTVDKANAIYIFNKKVEPGALESELKKTLTELGSETVLLRGDQNVLLGSAVNVMSIAKKAGARNIAILTAPEGNK